MFLYTYCTLDLDSTKEEEPPGAVVNNRPLNGSQLSDQALLDVSPEHVPM